MSTQSVFRMPTPMKITGRSSSITNSFVNTIVPVIYPSDTEISEALSLLGMDENNIGCAYCGDKFTEWDHLRPLVKNKMPTGYISEIGNLVPACGKCNQSKGNKYWAKWIVSKANLSPKTKGVDELGKRIQRLKLYESWRPREPFDFEKIIGQELWEEYWNNYNKVISAMEKSQAIAEQITALVKNVAI